MTPDAAGVPAAGDRTSDARRVSAPANLLLLGEYAVLEEGGRGLAVAPEVRATATLAAPRREDAGPTVRGRTPDGEARWPGDDGLLGDVANHLAATIGPLDGEVEIDTSSFFRADGRKRGYGSSASLTVALTAVWCGFDGTRSDRERVRRLATDAHRAAQGGRGSGYDVAASALGGIVLFTGGVHPRARRVELPWLPPLSLFEGRDPVATTGAVGRYRAWREAHTRDAEAFVSRSNELVDRFVASSTWDEARDVLIEYRGLALELGNRIGVPAEMEPEEPVGARDVSKAVGAGDELGVIFAPDLISGRAVTVAGEGVRWE